MEIVWDGIENVSRAVERLADMPAAQSSSELEMALRTGDLLSVSDPQLIRPREERFTVRLSEFVALGDFQHALARDESSLLRCSSTGLKFPSRACLISSAVN
jgi:hypothetical protein